MQIEMDTRRGRARRQTAGALVTGLLRQQEPAVKVTSSFKKSSEKLRPVVAVPPRGIGPVMDPNENDVLCGRGGSRNTHNGNLQFREMVGSRKEEYLSPATKKMEKAHIAVQLVQDIRAKDPPGRFLREDPDGLWYDIGDAKAIKKVGQALREDASEFHNANNEDPVDDVDKALGEKPMGGIAVTNNYSAPGVSTPRQAASCCFDVFLSHAGEDKHSIAIPLFREMRKRHLRPFLDAKRIPCGQHGPTLMLYAMRAAPIGVFILSPEALAKKWPFDELECFLSRYDEALGTSTVPPMIIPVFHRLTWQDCGLGHDDFVRKFGKVFKNPSFGFCAREATGQISKRRIMQALRRVREFSGIERNVGGDYGLIMETARVAQEEMKHHVQRVDGWEYFDMESKGESSSGSSIRARMPRLQEMLDTIKKEKSQSSVASVDYSSFILDSDELMHPSAGESLDAFSWALVCEEYSKAQDSHFGVGERVPQSTRVEAKRCRVSQRRL